MTFEDRRAPAIHEGQRKAFLDPAPDSCRLAQGFIDNDRYGSCAVAMSVLPELVNAMR